MKKVTMTPRSFKAWEENQKRLEFADRLGMNVSEVINEVLKDGLKQVIEKKMRSLRDTLSAPVP